MKLANSIFLFFLLLFPITGKCEKIKIFFNKDWIICKPENAVYYRIGNWSKALNFFDGEFIDFEVGKTMIARGFYKNRNKNGLFTFYHENGVKKLEAAFKDDKPSGIWNWYFPNEQIHYQMEFSKDQFEMLQLNSYDGNSTLDGKVVFTYASLDYFDNMSILVEGILVNGKKDGKWKAFLNSQNIGYDLYKNGEFIKSKYNVEVPSAIKPKVVNSNLFIPSPITEIEKMNLDFDVTDDDYKFLGFLFPWEPIRGAMGISDSSVFDPDKKPMYFKGINGLYDDIGRSTFLPMDVLHNCKNWGMVYFELILDENGDITERKILKTPDKMLNKVVFASLKYIGEFKPAYHDGKPVKSRILLRSQFNKPTY